MTRWLSEALQATEPFFRQNVAKLEAANGHPSHDIRLSAAVRQQAQAKLTELGLDPNDTTATELYHALLERVQADDQRLVKTLRRKAVTQLSLEATVADGLCLVLKTAAAGQYCFAIKPAKLKTIIRQLPPKKAMKQLGYRSLASMLKHESSACLLAAAWLCEGQRWQAQLLEKYKKLKPQDFESRPVSVIQPTSKHWLQLGQNFVSQRRYNLLSFKELGSLVLLPFPAETPPGAATISLALALHEMNEIKAASTFLKLSQVRKDFASQVQIIAADEPRLTAEVLDQPMPWQLVQRYYARTAQLGGIFEPHIQAEDMSWQAVEQALSQIEPRFAFWHNTTHLALLHDHQPVSFNVLDTALNYCNRLPFEQRLVHYFQQALRQELLLGYLQPATVEKAIATQLQPQLAMEYAES